MPVNRHMKIQVSMPLRLVVLIDRAAVDMRMRHGVAISRSAIIRAFIDLGQTADERRSSRRGNRRRR